MTRASAVFVGVATAVAIAALTGSRAPAQLAPNAVYDAAYDRWRALPPIPFETYDGRLTILRDGKTTTRLYAVAYRNSDKRCRIAGVAIDARDRPDPAKVSNHCLRPDYAFTFIPQAAQSGDALGLDLNVPTPEPAASDDLKVVASVRARARPYAITIAGPERVEGKDTTHLVLRPYRAPDKHVLRDLWIDPATNGVVRLRGEATSGPNLIHVDFTATYDEDATTQSLARVDAFAKAQLLFVRESGDVSFVLTNAARPASLPDALFETGRRR